MAQKMFEIKASKLNKENYWHGDTEQGGWVVPYSQHFFFFDDDVRELHSN